MENQTKDLAKKDPLIALINQDQIQKRFDQILGGKGGGAFLSSIVACWNNNERLQECDPKSVIAAGVMAATVNLLVTPGLGWAAIVPYKGQAQFQVMKDGYVQLALRTSQYRAINCSDVYADEFDSWNPHTGKLKTVPQEKWRFRDEERTEKIIGYLAYFQLLNGFEKYTYWTVKQLEAHGKKYSQSYKIGKGLWVENKPAMYLKTPLKMLIKHFGPLSTEMQFALEYDQAVRKPDGSISYPDGNVVDTTAVADPNDIPAPKRITQEKPKEAPKETAKPKKAERAEEREPISDEVTEKQAVPKGWEGPLSSMTEKPCDGCADNILKGQMMYRGPEGKFSHAQHYR